MNLFFINLILIIGLCNTVRVSAQCNAEHYHPIGYLLDIPEAKIIEDTIEKTTFAFWYASVDTNCKKLTCDKNAEIWIQKNNECGQRLWRKHIGIVEDTSADWFFDAIFTNDSCILVLGGGAYTGQGGFNSGTLFKINKNGQVIWKKAYGGRDTFEPNKITYNPYRNSYLITGNIERRLDRLRQRAYIMEVDSEGNLIAEKDILLNYDIEAADKKALKFDHVEAINDTTLVGLLSADTLFFAQLNEKLEVLWFKSPAPTNIRTPNAWTRPYFNTVTKEFITTTPEKESSSWDSTRIRWISTIDCDGNYTSNTPLGNYKFPYPLGWVNPTHDGGYILYANHIFKLNNQFHFTDTFALPHIEDYYSTEYYGAPELKYATQLKSGAYIGIGISGYRSNWDYAEVYIIQTDKDGNLTPNSPPVPQNPSISITPNPSYSGIFTIKAVQIPYQTVRVFNTSGQLVYTNDDAQTTIDLSTQVNGMYLITLQTKEGDIVHQQKVLLQQQ